MNKKIGVIVVAVMVIPVMIAVGTIFLLKGSNNKTEDLLEQENIAVNDVQDNYDSSDDTYQNSYDSSDDTYQDSSDGISSESDTESYNEDSGTSDNENNIDYSTIEQEKKAYQYIIVGMTDKTTNMMEIIYQCTEDIPINDLGYEQKEGIAEALKGLVEIVYGMSKIPKPLNEENQQIYDDIVEYVNQIDLFIFSYADALDYCDENKLNEATTYLNEINRMMGVLESYL